jgi:uncharacterized integral membrane protein
MRLLYWLIAAPLLVAAPLFAISNLETVDLSLWPLPDEWALSVPAFAVALGGLFIGFVAGGIVAWLNAGRARARARNRRAAPQGAGGRAHERRRAGE